MQQIIDNLLSKIDNPFVIFMILIVVALGWMLSKGGELKTLKDLFRKDQSEELRKAREELKDIQEETEFYDEVLRQEIFYNLIGIRCCREKREIYQRLVRDGIASAEGICHALLFIHSKNSKIEIRFNLANQIWLSFLIILAGLGFYGMIILLFDLLQNVSLPTFPSKLMKLSMAVLCCFGAAKEIIPMAYALGIRKRLRKWEERNREALPSPSIEIDTECEQSTQNS
ncbi:MAG: hypothetical protein D3917_16850 [Candidatus Electrothrix sp. AX5]|nr:hypothetical protein [Candidatus Electrothrix sp. AX5]